MGTVTTDSFQMDYYRFGKGERAFVILPGLSVQSVLGSARSVEKEYSLFAEAFTVYLFDRRRDVKAPYTVRDMARDSAEALIALGLREVYLFGASQGGMISMAVAAEYPQLVKKLALSSTCACVEEESFERINNWISLAENRDGEGLYLDFGRKVYPPELFSVYKSALEIAGRSVTDNEFERFVTIARGTRGFDIRDELKNIRCPVLVTGSSDDLVLGPDTVSDISNALSRSPDVETKLYSGFGHAVYDTAPDHRERLYGFFMK